MTDKELKEYIETVVAKYTLTLFSSLLETAKKILEKEPTISADEIWNKFAERMGVWGVTAYNGDDND